MGTYGACGLLFCAATRSGAFPPNMPAGLSGGRIEGNMCAGTQGGYREVSLG
jgi:hypothetical protein